MGVVHIVTLIGVTIAVAAIAIYLISIVWHLREVFLRLETILGAVEDVNDRSEGLGAIVDDISAGLAAGQATLEASVERLAARAEPAARAE